MTHNGWPALSFSLSRPDFREPPQTCLPIGIVSVGQPGPTPTRGDSLLGVQLTDQCSPCVETFLQFTAT